ncbi:MAG: hypothetical protein LBH97_03590, partial [Treponema sp.]|nr:hypothetical protein [Treponema sp.]
MSLFCLLWVPLFYLFRRSISCGESGGGVWALLLGSITAIFQFLLGSLVSPGGFGFSRWVSSFVDIVSLPVLVPLAVYLLLIVFRLFSGHSDFSGFILLWLVPGAALRSIGWSAMGSPLLLVLPPLLWTALATGIPLFVKYIFIHHTRWYTVVLSGLAILALPFAAATCWWAFFAQRTFLGILFLILSLLPMVISIVLD